MLHSKQQSHRYSTLSLRRGQGEVIFSNFVIINNAPAWINFDEGRVIMDGVTVEFAKIYLKYNLCNTYVQAVYETREPRQQRLEFNNKCNEKEEL
jgi:hypothetical protein